VNFEWDPRKAAQNERKHRVSFDEAMTVFADWESITVPDPDHSEGEERFLVVGLSARSRLLVVSHAERGENTRIHQREARGCTRTAKI
jgi:uncharacterized DUF497 family protein